MKTFLLFLFIIGTFPTCGMLRPSIITSAMHRPRNPRRLPARKQITIYTTAYGLMETLRLRACTQKDADTPALPEERKLSSNHYLQPTHIRVKRRPNTISQKRKESINGKEFEGYHS